MAKHTLHAQPGTTGYMVNGRFVAAGERDDLSDEDVESLKSVGAFDEPRTAEPEEGLTPLDQDEQNERNRKGVVGTATRHIEGEYIQGVTRGPTRRATPSRQPQQGGSNS